MKGLCADPEIVAKRPHGNSVEPRDDEEDAVMGATQSVLREHFIGFAGHTLEAEIHEFEARIAGAIGS